MVHLMKENCHMMSNSQILEQQPQFLCFHNTQCNEIHGRKNCYKWNSFILKLQWSNIKIQTRITLKYDLYVFQKKPFLKINYYIEHYKRVAAEIAAYIIMNCKYMT